MAKIQIKSEKLTPVGVNIFNHGAFDSTLSSVIDSTLGLGVDLTLFWNKKGSKVCVTHRK